MPVSGIDHVILFLKHDGGNAYLAPNLPHHTSCVNSKALQIRRGQLRLSWRCNKGKKNYYYYYNNSFKSQSRVRSKLWDGWLSWVDSSYYINKNNYYHNFKT